MTGFWKNWLTGWCWAVCLFGVVLAMGGVEATSGPVHIIFALLNGPGEFTLDHHMRFSLAVLGAVTIGWSITLLAAAKAANQLEEQTGKSIWGLITVSVVSWFVIDSTLSVTTGFALNAVLNTFFMAAFLLPVIRCGLLRR